MNTARSISVVLDGPPTPAWQARALAQLDASPLLAVAQVRLSRPPGRGIVRRCHGAIERRLLHLGADPLAPAAVEPRERDPDATTAPDANGLVVWLSERPPEAPGSDVLSLRHALRFESAEDALRRAMLSGASSLETELLLGRGKEHVVIERTVSEMRPFSVTLALDLMLWKLAAAVVRAAERLPGLDEPALPDAPDGRAPAFARLLARSAVAWPRMVATRLLYRRPWSVRLRDRGAKPTVGWTGADDRTDELVSWTPGSMYADPFLFEHDGRHHLFCEEVPIGAARAVISHTELAPDGDPAPAPTPVLSEPHHLSYPFVFAHEGELFMIPESSAARRVELYRAVCFPREWRHETVLIDDLDAADATLLAHDDRLWLFAGVAEPHASSLDELHLYWADELSGPWHSHPGNPIVSDARCARPGGAIQRWGERLVRPGQDGSRRYGGAISFRQIDVLTTERYAEHEIARLDPADVRGARATHTYSCDGRFEAIDLRRRELRAGFRLAALAGDRRRGSGHGRERRRAAEGSVSAR